MTLILVAGGALQTAATLYDASALTRAVGLPSEGGEAIVVVAALTLAAVLVVLGWRRRAGA